MRVCTVICAAERPHARALAAAPAGVELTALVLDEPTGSEPFEVIRPGDLEGAEPWRLYGLPLREQRRYLEPFLLARFSEPVVLLAPGVQVRGPLDALL